MSGANPWSVKGIDPKVREAARDAARRQGVTLGEYLNQALAAHESAQHGADASFHPRARPSPRPMHHFDDMDMEEDWRLMPPPAPQRMSNPNIPLAQRLELIERRTQLAIVGLDRSIANVDRSMMGLSQRVDDAEGAAGDAADKVVQALEQFRAAHEALNGKLKDAEAHVIESRRALEGATVSVEDVRATLQKRVESAEQSARDAESTAIALANRLATMDESLSRRVTEIEARSRGEIQAALGEARAAAEEATRAVGKGAVAEIKSQQEALGQRLAMTEQAARQAAHNAVSEIRAARQELSDRLERVEHAQPSGGALADLQAAQAVLARRLAECESGVRTVSETSFEEMRRIQAALAARIEHAGVGGAPNASLEEVRSAQALLTHRMEIVEQSARDATAGLRQAAGAAIADLRNAHLGLAARVKQIEDTPVGAAPELAARVDSLAARVTDAETRGARDSDSLRDETRAFGERIDGALHALTDRLSEGETHAAEMSGVVRTIEQSVERLTQRLAQTESTANSVIRKLEEVDQAEATEALRVMLEDRLQQMARSTAAAIAGAREEMGREIADLGAEDIRAAVDDVSRRLTSAERRQAQTIEAISIEIKRMSESVDRRLRTVEARPTEDASQAVREEIERMRTQLAERFEEIEQREAAALERVDERLVSIETRSATAIEQIGEHVARMAERFNQRHEQFSRDVNQDIAGAEERMQARLSQAVAAMTRHLDEMESADDFAPPPTSLSAVADRLSAAFPTQQAPPLRAAPIIPASPPPHDDIAFIDDDDLPLSEEEEAEAIAFQGFSTPVDAPPLAHDDFEALDIELDDAPAMELTAPTLDLAAEDAPPPPPVEDEDLFWSTEPDEHAEFTAAPQDRDPETDDDADAFNLDLEVDPFEESEASLPPLTEESSPPAKEDYLAAARRAAVAQSLANAKPAKKAKKPKAAKPQREKPSRDAAGPRPVAGLRGPGRVILWGAAGALAVAMAGGIAFLRAQTDDAERADIGPNDLGPPSALAEPAMPGAPDESLFSDEGAPLTDDAMGMEAPADAPTEGEPQASLPPGATQVAAMSPTAQRAGPVAQRSTTLEQALAAGDAVAQYDAALQRISAGRPSEAAPLLRRAATQGLAMAQYRLAKLYERGEGVPADLTQSRQWTERAAAGGNRRAMHDLGVYYARGEGAPLDEPAAFRWFRQAAELGVTDSQYNLGVLYQQGRGVAASATDAMFWFLVAARSGDADARLRAASVEAALTQTQADSVRARAEAFRPRAASSRANGEFGARPWSRAEAEAARGA